MSEFLWISEADVVTVMDMNDAIDAVEAGLTAEARGTAENMQKTVVAWQGGTLHALGATFDDAAGTKTWAHTEGGATPLLVMYDRANGSLRAVIEASALGQLRTGATSGVATRWLSREDAAEMAIIGTGKQALAQVAAIAAVRPLRRVRVYGRNEERRRAFVSRVREQLGIDAIASASVADAVKDVPIITTITRAREPFLSADMIAPGTHINAIGAIVPGGAEIGRDVVERSGRIVIDSIPQAQKLARELIGVVKWESVDPLSKIIASQQRRRGDEITLFKSLGIGISDLALGTLIYQRAVEQGLGRSLPHPEKVPIRLRREPARRKAFRFAAPPAQPKHRPHEPVLISRGEIESEIARLAALTDGPRISKIVNPVAGVGDGLAPGTAVTLSVLKPGERTTPVRENASQINFCISGRGTAMVGGKRINFSQYDAFNVPPWSVYQYSNDSDELQVRLTYSNSALLEKLNVHVVETDPAQSDVVQQETDEDARQEHPFGTMPLTDDGAYIMPYEKLINPDVVHMEALHWPWKKVKEELDKLTRLGKSYVGRRLYLLYNPATGRTNGTSHTFFATICLRPANIVDRPHRHTASAINYFFKGSGSSVIEGKRYEWKAGDLMLTAPGWAVHNHSSHGEDVYELTIQDSPLQIAMGSLLWQEDLKRPPQVLGTTGGFVTNRETEEVSK